MKIIRRNCFETNSSSTHSISISSSDDLNQTVPLDSNGNFTHILSGDYGWEINDYNDVISKIDYMGIYARDWAKGREEYFKSILEGVIQNQSGAKSVNVDFGQKKKSEYTEDYEYYENGYIDHQSVECSDYDYLFEEPSKLHKFLFSSQSSFRTDNDNH